MSYRERLTRLESILRIDKLSKKYNLKARTSLTGSGSMGTFSGGSSSSGGGGGGGSESEVSTPSFSEDETPLVDKPGGGGAVLERGVDPIMEEQQDTPGDSISLPELKKLVFHGLPGDSQYRALVWRLLLNYLPPNSIDVWDEFLAKKRSNYRHFVRDLLLHDDQIQQPQQQQSGECERVNNSISDHPLNLEPDSKWQVFFKDNEVLLQIDKDCRRLCPEISFFQTHTPYPNEHIVSRRMDRLHKRVQSCVLESSTVIRKGLGVTKIIGKDSGKSCSSSSSFQKNHQQTTTPPTTFSGDGNPDGPEQSNGSSGKGAVSCASAANNGSSSGINCPAATQQRKQLSVEEENEYHWEVVERILFIYAKLNPGQSYVQGMNEIIGPIYYTLANDPNMMWREFAEADTFYLFTNLMGEVRDFFIRSLDNSVSGIKRMMELLMERLKLRDQSVYERLVQLEIHPQYYAFRWITLLMSQEFALPEVLRIWDSLLSDLKRFDFLIDLASAMIINLRSDLLSGDFPSNMKLLQNYPPIDVRDILTLANSFTVSS